jgi:hypothetical protein
MAYYRDQRVRAIHLGLVAMRRRSGPAWVRIEDAPGKVTEPIGPAIEQGFAAADFLQAHADDDQLLRSRLRVSPEARLDQQMRYIDGAWRVAGMRLHFTAGLRYVRQLDPLVAKFLEGFDGGRSLGELVRDLAAQASVEAGVVQQECLTMTRQLLRHGFLRPV